MRLAVDTLIDGVVQTLLDTVLPDVRTRFARGQLWAAIDVLRNLRDRVELRASLLTEEADSAAAALARVETALHAAGAAADAARIAELRTAAPPAPPLARAVALRAALVATVPLLDALPASAGAAARTALGEHLAAQAMRDLAVLKPSLLAEISKG